VRFLRPIAVVALVAGCGDAAAPAVDPPAYDPTQLSAGVLYRWPTGRTVAVFVDPEAVPVGVDLVGTAAAGMAAWTSALGGGLIAFRAAATAADADIIVHVSAAPRRVGLAGCAEPPGFASGATVFCPARDSALTLPLNAAPPGHVKVDISINPAAAGAAHPLAALVTHELGHAVGIGGHSADTRDVMHASPAVSTPSGRDVTTLRWVVRQPIGIRL
jgi:hypothetical protein